MKRFNDWCSRMDEKLLSMNFREILLMIFPIISIGQAMGRLFNREPEPKPFYPISRDIEIKKFDIQEIRTTNVYKPVLAPRDPKAWKHIEVDQSLLDYQYQLYDNKKVSIPLNDENDLIEVFHDGSNYTIQK